MFRQPVQWDDGTTATYPVVKITNQAKVFEHERESMKFLQAIPRTEERFAVPLRVEPIQAAKNADVFERCAGKIERNVETFAIAMPNAGPSLYEMLKKRSEKLELAYAKELCHYLVDSVAILHANSLTHGDINVHNACVDARGVGRWIDFGTLAHQGDNMVFRKLHDRSKLVDVLKFVLNHTHLGVYKQNMPKGKTYESYIRFLQEIGQTMQVEVLNETVKKLFPDD
jgi:tRNA A-37 threonylcarbamoyl transferase component Bud32